MHWSGLIGQPAKVVHDDWLWMPLVIVQEVEASEITLVTYPEHEACIDEDGVIGVANEFSPQPAPKPWYKQVKKWASVHFLLIGILLALIVAGVYPSLGAAGGPLVPSITSALIAVPGMFFLSGATIRLRDFGRSARVWWFNLYVQGFTWIFIPLSVFVVVKLLELAAYFSSIFLDGLLIMACVPMTINNSFVLARAVHGNEAAAIFNSVVANFSGVFLSPLLIIALVAPVEGFDFGAVTTELSYKVCSCVDVNRSSC